MSTEANAGATFLAPAFFISVILHALVLAIPRALYIAPTDNASSPTPARALHVQIVAQSTATSAIAEASIAPIETPATIASEPTSIVSLTPTANPTPQPAITDSAIKTPIAIEYLQPEQLTEMPQILGLGNLELPGVIKPGDSGRLVLDILLSNQGKVDGIRVLEASVSPAFMSNALRIFEWAEYTPGKELSRPIASRLRVEVTLDPDSTPRVSSQTRAYTSDGR